jgi:hypothetical protein
VSARRASFVAVLLSAVSAGPATKPANRAGGEPAGDAARAPNAPAAPNARAAPKAPAAPKAEIEIDRAALPPVGVVRQLEGEDRHEAVRLRDAADLARAAFERQYRAHPKPFPPESDAAFEDVVAAYREVITRFPGTEADCYCRIRLSGAYLYRGKRPQALDEAKQAAEVFAGTRLGLEADFTVARHYLNPFRDPARATVWLNRVQAALPLLKDPQERQKMELSFQQAWSELEKLRRERP